MHTAPDHALTMLGTSDQLAAGLGAQPRLPKSQEDTLQKEHGANRPGDDVGNAQLRLWIGERFLGMWVPMLWDYVFNTLCVRTQ